MSRLTTIVIASILTATLAGCGGSGYDTTTVTGLVTLDGKPLADARIGFEPIRVAEEIVAGPGSYAKTDDTGQFTLTTADGQPGAILGKHRIWIRSYAGPVDQSEEAPLEITEHIPARYNSETQLSEEVTADGANHFEFKLTSDPE